MLYNHRRNLIIELIVKVFNKQLINKCHLKKSERIVSINTQTCSEMHRKFIRKNDLKIKISGATDFA